MKMNDCIIAALHTNKIMQEKQKINNSIVRNNLIAAKRCRIPSKDECYADMRNMFDAISEPVHNLLSMGLSRDSIAEIIAA